MQLPQTLEIFEGDRVIITPVYNRLDPTPLVFEWNMGDETLPDAEKADHIYEHAGTYAVQLTVKGENGPDCLKTVHQIAVTVHEPPQAEISVLNSQGQETIYTGGARDTAHFSATIKNNKAQWNYTWNFGDGQELIGPEVEHVYIKPGAYDVVLTLSDALQRTSQTFQFSKKINVVRRQ